MLHTPNPSRDLRAPSPSTTKAILNPTIPSLTALFCMDVPRGTGDGTSGNRRTGSGKQTGDNLPANAPCGACKFLRRKCNIGCIFAPHFGPDQGSARFAAVHKVFGASNVSKLLSRIPVNRRHDAAVTIWYEAQARLSDPVYGCVSTLIVLQQQVASLQAELSVVQTQLLNNRFVIANALQTSPPHHHVASVLQPAYSGTSAASINHVSMHSFGPNFGKSAPSNSFKPLHHLSGRAVHEEVEESHDHVAFANHVFH